MQLSDKAIRALKPKEKTSKATGGQALHILVMTPGIAPMAIRLSLVPTPKMKMRHPHAVPLSPQALAAAAALNW